VLAFCIQVMPAAFGLRAMLAMSAYGVLEPVLCFFNAVLALGMIVIRSRHRSRSRDEQTAQCHGR
jgi:hypothetical protein